MNFLRCLFAVCYKDLLGELRHREICNTLLFFAVLVVFLFSFALGTDPNLLKKIAPGLLWLVVLFSVMLALERSYQSEAEEGCLDRLVLYSVSPRAVFLGKLLTNLLFILIVQWTVLFLMMILFDLGWFENFWRLSAILFLGDLGVATLGTFYAALLARTRAAQVMLPLLLFPMLIPLLLASVYATEAAWLGELINRSSAWLQMLTVFDAIFLAACLLLVEPLMEA